ncbi:FAD/NAD(P)-binding protein [Streptomyces sp. NPDC055186]
MFDSLDTLEFHIRNHLRENRFYSKQSWVEPAVTPAGEKIHDVAVIGAGQNGLALAYRLKLRGIRRVQVIDAQPLDQAGPWSSFARMPQLRTPKAIPGPDCGNPLLSFKAWFCSLHSAEEYEEFDFIPIGHWRQYLAWFRQVLDIDVLADTTVHDISWDPAAGCLRFDWIGAAETAGHGHARKLCLATGMTSTGRWAPPARLADRIPSEALFCAWEPIPPTALADADVAVIGAGASGFDNAAHAVDSGCRSVTVIARSPFPKKDLYFELWCGRDDSGTFPEEAGSPPADVLDAILAHHSALPDADRIRLVSRLFQHGRSPANPDYLARVQHLDRMNILEGWRIEEISHRPDSGRILIRGNGEEREFDRVVLATGPDTGLAYRPELRRFADRILTWADAVEDSGDMNTGEAEAVLPYGLAGYPKLSASFQLQAVPGRPVEGIGDIYSLADLIHTTVGLQSIQHLVPVISEHIAVSLFHRQLDAHLALVEEIVR